MRFICRIFSVILALLLSLSFAEAQDTSAQKSKISLLEKEISQLQKQISETGKRSNNALNELTLIRKQIATRKALVDESEKQIRVLDDSIRVVRRQSNELKARLDTLTTHYEKLIRSVYKNRDTRVWYIYILSSKDLNQATRRLAYFKNLSSQMSTQAATMKDLREQLNADLARLSKLRSQANALRASRQQALDKLKIEETNSKKLVSTLKNNKTRYQNQLTTKRKQVEKLNKEIEKIIAQYTSTSSKTNKNIDYKLAAEFEANKGKLPWPADGPVLEKFGRSKHEVFTRIVMPFNNGIGIGLSKGSEVATVFGGEVKKVIVMPGYNKCVLVQHGNYFTFYCKLADVSVKAGDKVSLGQKIGVVDTIDNQTLLHFEVWQGTKPQNPEIWLRKK